MKLFILLVVALVASAKVRYDGYQVFEIIPKNLQQFNLLVKMTDWVELDFWMAPSALGRPVQVMIPPDRIQAISKHLSVTGMTYTVIRENVQIHLDEEEERLAKKGELYAYDFADYNPFAEYYPELDLLAADCPSGFTCTTYSIGQSYEGNNMTVLNIDGGRFKPGVWVDSQIHCREWITGTTLMKMLDKMIRQYGSDAESTFLMDSFNWWFMPQANPDGYIYTWTDDRYWRKSRSPNAGSSCMGTDLNRNWDDHWSGSGSSGDPCSDTYHGAAPESEIEVANIVAEMLRLGSDIHALVTIHSQGQLWLHPYGWSCNDSPDQAELYRIARITADATEATHNTAWDAGSCCQVLYAASGITVDWAYSGAGILYSYTPELRGPGHDPPVSEIEPSFEEVWNGLVALCGEI